MRRPFAARALVAATLFAAALPASATPGYYRFPAVHGETVVFTAEGDLWSGPLAGGEAQRLTTHAGQETHSALSPDGRRIAFVGQYEGPGDVYTMPIDGGLPKRLSFDGGRVEVHGWSPQGEVVYSSEDLVGPTLRRVLRLVDPATLATRELPLHDAQQAAFDDRGRVLFTRFGAHVNGDNARGYRGGAMGQLWLYDPATDAEARRLGSDSDGAMHSPMWLGGRWYFIGNADGHDNLWSMAADGSDRRQHTRHAPFDVRAARTDGTRIVYQRGADLHAYTPGNNDDRVVPVALVSDFERRRERWLERPLRFLESASLAPQGDRFAVTVRGRVALAGPGPRRRVEIAIPPEHRAREAMLSPDGRHVYAIADTDGRPEIWRFAADGSSDAKALTRDGTHHRWTLSVSPDGKQLAHTDKSGALHLLDLDSGRNTTIDRGRWGGDDPHGRIAWSPDSRALVFSRADTRAGRDQIVLYRLGDAAPTVLTSDRYVSYAPSFSADGRWLYFLSDRAFVASPSGPWGDRNTGPGFDRRSKVYALALQPGLRFPFALPDELAPATEPAPAKGNGDSEAATAAPIVIEGLAQRLFEAPVPAGNYSELLVGTDRLYLLDREGDRGVLKSFGIAAQGSSLEVLAGEVRSAQISTDRKRIGFVQRRGETDPILVVIDAGPKLPPDLTPNIVRVNDWRLPIDPPREWAQIFADAWRMHRDFSFDDRMRGLDWAAVRAQYEPLLARVTDRAELDDLLGQMIAPLGILHSQVRGSELPVDAEAAAPAMLGAALEQTAEGLRIARIYRTDAELPSERSPLAQPGVDARDGDRLVAVNGRAVRHAGELAAALHHQAGQQVLLTLERDSREIRSVVVPVDAPRNATLRYSDWVQGRIAAVEREGEGRIGYLHLRAMGPNDIASFVRDFYANVDREGLVIDVRRNRGGNIDSWIIAALLRRTWAFWQPPGQAPYWNMQQSFRGHLVVLTDALTYSDGETFAAGVKALGLGPVVGTRTSGAGIWLADRNRLSDGGFARIAEFGQFGADGRWLIEGRGVSPDVEVDNLPRESYAGRDRQLETALAMLKEKLSASPVVQPPAQRIPPPDQPGQDVAPAAR
ncbi:S41 family peptidase [Silanimonas sp.]|jgi:tricorn protease|uniref:S41 family peptidase n=1 Tax=Silanimonas sp. TaxID=1929290 RepID=UPI0037C9833F